MRGWYLFSLNPLAANCPLDDLEDLGIDIYLVPVPCPHRVCGIYGFVNYLFDDPAFDFGTADCGETGWVTECIPAGEYFSINNYVLCILLS